MNARRIKVAILSGSALAAMVLGGGVAYAAATSPASTVSTPAPAVTQAVVTQAQNAAPGADSAASATEKPDGAAETATPETDGPGGHADANGVNVDHQFNGNE
jgi:hypothetical protein